ncbi:putative ribonuclease H-like domain-containing protein [Tanacetum coccineum]|uniref:Ribonuclease H-like domain-containing protein n=1 Tax=Tanacetum coccineum TaxID=301880 RepID=A0ABQ4ZK75_9ASTR
MPRNRLGFLTKPQLSAYIAVTRPGQILLENADPRGIKIIGGEMLETLGILKKTMGEDLVNRRTLKLCLQTQSQETHESMPETIVIEPTVVTQPKVWNDAPIIEEYESDSEDEHVELNKQKGKGNVQKENKPAWNNVQRVNHKNQFVPTTDYPQRALQNKGIVDSGCSRHMTGNKAYLAEYQDFNGGPVAFRGSKGYITGKEAESAQDYFVLPIWSSYTSTVKSSKAMNAGENPNKNHDLKTDEKPIDNEDQVFLDELKSQEKDANDAVEALRKEFAQDTEDLLLQAGAAKASSTNTVNTASTPVSTANSDQDDSEIPALEEIYDNPTAGIFTNASYDDEGPVADFTNLETIMNASPIPTSRINSIHPSTLILGDQKSAVQTRSKVTKSSGAYAFIFALWEESANWNKIGLQEIRRKKRRIEAIRIFLAFASYMGFIVYQMDVKSAFSYDKIDEELPEPDDIIFGSTKRSWCDEFETLMKSRFQMSSMGELTFFLGLQVKQKVDGIFISQDKYVAEILKKFDFASVKTASTLIETQKPLVKDEEASDVDVHLYRSMIGSLMYLTASRPDIMFAVCACSSDICWKKNLDRKSTTGGCQFLGRRLISWQCKKQTIVATSTTEAEYVAAANCCGQVLWIQNQMLDYGFNFMNTKIYIDNESTICIVKNLVFHSKTKHIAIRHHFIRDAYEKKLIQVLKIHTDDNVADLLTKAFDVSIFQFLVVTIRYESSHKFVLSKGRQMAVLESLERDIDGTEELLLPDLFIFWLTKVSTDSAKLIPLGKDSTAIKTLEKIPPRV